jgi:hypothetical protein
VAEAAIAAGIAGLTREHDPRRVAAGIVAADTEKMDGSRTPTQMTTHVQGAGGKLSGRHDDVRRTLRS